MTHHPLNSLAFQSQTSRTQQDSSRSIAPESNHHLWVQQASRAPWPGTLLLQSGNYGPAARNFHERYSNALLSIAIIHKNCTQNHFVIDLGQDVFK